MTVREHFERNARAYLILVISLTPGFFAFYRVGENVEGRDRIRFERVVRQSVGALEERLDRCVDELGAIRGLFAASIRVQPAEWNRYLASLSPQKRNSGIRSIGFVQWVRAADLPAHLATVRREIPDYEVAVIEGREVFLPLVYLTEFGARDGLRRGLDFSRNERLEAVLRDAARGASAVVTESLGDLGLDPGASQGFQIFLPLYVSGIPEEADDRERDLAGFVFVSILYASFFERVIPPEGNVDAEIFMMADANASRLVHDIDEVLRSGSGRAGRFQEEIELSFLNSVWRCAFTSMPAFDAESPWYLRWLVLAGGCLVSGLLFRISSIEAGGRFRAENLNLSLRRSEEKIRKANEDLAYERDLLNALLNHSPDRVYFKDANSRFIKAGTEVARRLNFKDASALAGKWDFDFFDDVHARAAYEDEQRIIRTGEPVVGKVEREVWKGGEIRWVLTTKLALRDTTGAVIGTFGISKDITDLKRSEEALAGEKERLAVTLRAIGEGVVSTDRSGRVVLFNKAAEAMIGRVQREALGLPIGEVLPLVDPAGKSAWPGPLEAVLEKGGRVEGAAATLLCGDGSRRLVAYSVSSIHDHGDEVTGAVLVFRDVTEARRIEEELLKASKLESVGVLAGGIAHDFNNILTAITGNLSLARSSAHSTEKLMERIADAEAAAARARDLARHLLTFAEGGDPIRKTLQLRERIRKLATLVVAGSKVRCEFEVAPDLWVIDADEAQFGQVINNLVLNAREAMPEGGRIEISAANVILDQNEPAPVEAEAAQFASHPSQRGQNAPIWLPSGKYIRISIRDQGRGIEPGNLAKVFDPYFSTKGHGGLGLATAYSIIRRHDGRIDVESAPGEGSVFHVYLPAAAVAVAEGGDSIQPRLLAPGRILVMDDEENIRRVAAMMLEAIGYEVETACDGAEAISRYCRARSQGRPFDAVIMDLSVPDGMGGKEAIRQLKEIDPFVKAIVSSGYSYDPVMANYREHGFSGVMPKPYQLEDIRRALLEVLGEAS